MLQLATSGGTYPVETTPLFFQVIHPLLPMSYAVSGLREVITGGIDARLWTSVAYLGALLVVSLALTAWRAGRMRTWTLGRLHPCWQTRRWVASRIVRTSPCTSGSSTRLLHTTSASINPPSAQSNRQSAFLLPPTPG